MKNLKIMLSGMIFCSSIAFGQTNVIALKSHMGKSSELVHEKDNFGEHPGMSLIHVDSVKYFAKDKVLVTYHKTKYGSSYRDSVSYKNYSDTDIKGHLKAVRLSNWYPETTKFIGFPKEVEKIAKDETKGIKLNTLSFWLVFSILGAGVFTKRF